MRKAIQRPYRVSSLYRVTRSLKLVSFSPAAELPGPALLATVVAWLGPPGPPGPPGAAVAGKEVGVGKPPWSPAGPAAGPGPAWPPCRLPIRPQPAELSAAATRAGFMGRAPMLRPAMFAIGLLPDWPPPLGKNGPLSRIGTMVLNICQNVYNVNTEKLVEI